MKIYLLRHGRTSCNDQRRYQGKLDIPLSAAGEAELLAAECLPDTVYVSPLRRTWQTAAIVFPAARQIVVDGLREMDFGAFDGRTASEMEHDADYRAWVDGGCLGQCPGGESRAMFCDRACAAFVPLLEHAAVENTEQLVVVAHGGTLRAVMERFALPRRDYYDWTVGNGCGYALSWDAALWREQRKLRFLEKLCFTRGEETC